MHHVSCNINEIVEFILNNEVEVKHDNVCVLCGNPADQFSDLDSAQEFEISGLCQHCQDEIFSGADS